MPDLIALLGPTNTGKTHRAVERMLEHPSGLLGVPLRLLARELYDRVARQLGEPAVALVTGEEKRVPPHPRYWICTVEAMPLALEVDFLAVDEIQLAAHPQRGHAFTDRLLHARGRQETWFLGSETVRPLVEQLLPTARIRRHPRLSALRSAGTVGLGALPPRSAVVAFSAARVYELAEQLRIRRGGAAVVVGALSPRARNAQVALYEAGEVDYLVATDAIGMGLNLDVDHVVFADRVKFDGRETRELGLAELGQIAGRAGRHRRDGTFGTLAPLPPLLPGVVHALEQHRFPFERSLFWRNADLDLADLDALAASLRRPPPHAALRAAPEAEDVTALGVLARDPEVRRRARGAERVALLWDVCRIPDYRQLMLGDHHALQAEIFTRLVDRGRLGDDWLRRRILATDAATGDLDTLLANLATVRTWSYVGSQARWVEGSAELVGLTRAVEDRLSDALHDRLVERFVQLGRARARRTARAAARAPAAPAAPTADHDVARRSSPFAALLALRLPDAPAVTAAAPPSVDALPARLRLDAAGTLLDGDLPLGRLRRGADLLRPEVVVTAEPAGAVGDRARVERRVLAWCRDAVAALLRPVTAGVEALDPELRGLCYRLERGLGGAELEPELAALAARLSPEARATLARRGVTVGERYAFVRRALGAPALELRAALVNTWFEPAPALAAPGALTTLPARPVSREALLGAGFVRLGPRWVRMDAAEKLAAALAAAAPAERPAVLARGATWLGCAVDEAEAVALALGLPTRAPTPPAPLAPRERPL